MNTKYPASVTVFSDYFSALLDDQSSGTTLLDPKCHRVEAETDDFDHLVKEIAERTIISKRDAHNAGAASADERSAHTHATAPAPGTDRRAASALDAALGRGGGPRRGDDASRHHAAAR